MDAGTTDRNEVLFGQGIDNHQCFVVRRGLAKRGPQLMGASVNYRPRARPVFDTGARANDGCRDPSLG